MGFTKDPISELTQQIPFVLPFGIFGAFRLLVWIVKIIGWLLYRPQKPGKADKHAPGDVSVVVPTLGADRELFEPALLSWLNNKPNSVVIVTTGAFLRPPAARVLAVLRRLPHCTACQLLAFRAICHRQPHTRKYSAVNIEKSMSGTNAVGATPSTCRKAKGGR